MIACIAVYAQGSREWWVVHQQLAVHEGGCQVAQLHPAADCWKGNLPRQAAGAVLYHGQRCADARRPLKRLHSNSSFLNSHTLARKSFTGGCWCCAAPWAALCRCEAPSRAPAEPHGCFSTCGSCLIVLEGWGPCREQVRMQERPPGACSVSETHSTLHGHLPDWVVPLG